MKHNWSSGADGSIACCRCSKLQTDENKESDTCGARAPFVSYLDDPDFLIKRCAEIRAEIDESLQKRDDNLTEG